MVESEARNYFGYGSYEELYEERLSWDYDIDFYYYDEKYMISAEPINGEWKMCFSYISKSHEVYLKTLQVYDSYEELFERAYFQDGVMLKDEVKKPMEE